MNCQHCGKGFPTRVKIDGKVRNLCRRKFCFECSPFGSRNTKTYVGEPPLPKTKTCPRCEKRKKIGQFYSRRGKVGNSGFCKDCHKEDAIRRGRLFKLRCIEYKGGKCIHCGYNKCSAALQFHHRNPKEKEFGLAGMKNRTSGEQWKKVQAELDKCDLVCGNCHAEIHWSLDDLKTLH